MKQEYEKPVAVPVELGTSRAMLTTSDFSYLTEGEWDDE
jgi:hypothetical protein